MPNTLVVTRVDLTLDWILFRTFGTKAHVMLPLTLALNPGLAAQGVKLTLGQKILLPEAPLGPPPKSMISLFS